jgi:hypothetical protein
VKIGIFVFIAIAVLVSVSDIRKMIRLSAKLDPFFLGLSFCAAFVSYLLIAFSLKKILELMDIGLPFLEIFTISLVSTSINYVLSTGGVGGFPEEKGGLLQRYHSRFHHSYLYHERDIDVIRPHWICNLNRTKTNPNLQFYRIQSSHIRCTLYDVLGFQIRGQRGVPGELDRPNLSMDQQAPFLLFN